MEALVVYRLSSGLAMPVKQNTEPASLLHLPDELLLHVIKHLDRGDLYSLSVQCKRLQRISLPRYLLLYGITTPLIFPIDHLEMAWGHFLRRGIPLAFFAKDVRRFSCYLSRNANFNVYRFNSTLALERLHRMIVHFEGLEDVTFDFGSYGGRKHFVDSNLKEVWVHLVEHVGNRCPRLALHFDANAIQWWTPYDVSRVAAEAKKWRSGPPVMRSFKEHMLIGISRLRSSHPPTHHSESYPLKTLILKSNIFLFPVFCGWAFKVLNTAPLTRLDLIEVYLPSDVSALFFGSLTIPTLEHLRIINPSWGLDFDAVAEFLPRHRTISSFDFVSVYKNHTILHRSTLPRLVSLNSNPVNICRLLTPTGAFPKLARVCVTIYLPYGDQFMFDKAENSLARAAKRLTKTNVRLRMDLLGRPARHERRFDYSKTLPNDLRDYPVLSLVREIAFHLPHKYVDNTSIETWLSLFPLLEHVEFHDTRVGIDDQTRMMLLGGIAQKCTGIRSIRIGEDTRDVSAWLSSESYQ